MAILEDLIPADRLLYETLDQQVMGRWYNKPPAEDSHLVAGTRPANVVEINNLAADACKEVHECLGHVCFSRYAELQHGTRPASEAYPEGWPRVPPTHRRWLQVAPRCQDLGDRCQ